MKKLILGMLVTVQMAFAGNVDVKKSVVKWEGSKVTGKHFGKVFIKDGDVKMTKGKLTSGDIVVDLSNFTVEDLEGEWAEKFLGHMKSADFFEISKYPTAKLKIKKVEGNKVTADLTIRNKTNEETFEVKQVASGFSGKLVFDRTKYDMKYGAGTLKELGDKLIYNDVTLDFDIVVK
jgi:polyisoprenoid-binding protein YceI